MHYGLLHFENNNSKICSKLFFRGWLVASRTVYSLYQCCFMHRYYLPFLSVYLGIIHYTQRRQNSHPHIFRINTLVFFSIYSIFGESKLEFWYPEVGHSTFNCLLGRLTIRDRRRSKRKYSIIFYNYLLF